MIGHLCQQKCLWKLLLMKSGWLIVHKSDTNMKCICNAFQMSSELDFWVKMWWKRYYVFHTIPPFSIKSRWYRADNVYIAVSLSFFFSRTGEEVAKILYYNILQQLHSKFFFEFFSVSFLFVFQKKKSIHRKKTCWFNHSELYFWVYIKSQCK